MIERLDKFKQASKAEKAVIIWPLIIQGYKTYRYGKVYLAKYKAKNNCSISIDKTSWFSPVAAAWASSLTNKIINNIEAESNETWDEEQSTYIYQLSYYFADSSKFTFNYGGYTYIASFEMPNKSETPTDTITALVSNMSSVASKASLYFVCPNIEAMSVLKEKLDELHDTNYRNNRKRRSNQNEFYVLNKQGSWSSSNREKRPLSSVVLKNNLLELIVNDLQEFIDKKSKYFAKGIPWRRGYLFYGPPGTGKSSIIKALASHFNRNLYFLSLNDINSDSELIDAISRIKPDGILLMEDIDVFSAPKSREDHEDPSGVTLSGLLNVLDGPAAPDGLITFMSTNYRDRLDSALLRKGRVDFEAEIGLPDLDQVSRLWSVFYEEPFGVDQVPEGTSTAVYFDIFKRNLDTPDIARQEIIDLVGKPVVEFVKPKHQYGSSRLSRSDSLDALLDDFDSSDYGIPI